jgi:hypothetical protein
MTYRADITISKKGYWIQRKNLKRFEKNIIFAI